MEKIYKHDIGYVKEFIGSNSECSLLSEEYVNSNSKMSFMCGCGNKFETTFGRFKFRNKRQCNKCSTRIRLSKEDIEGLCDSYKLKILDKDFEIKDKTKLNLLTEDGYKLRLSIYSLKNMKKISVFSVNNIYTIENIKTYIDRNELKCALISDKFTGYGKIDLEFKCGCGEIFIKSLADFVDRKRHLCKKCALESVSGKNHYAYNVNLSEDDRIRNRVVSPNQRIRDWRKKVFENHNYECFCCKNKSSKDNRVVLNAHHLNGYHWYEKGRFDPYNGVCLCYDCHFAFHKVYGRKWNTKEQFEEFISLMT